MLDLDISKLMLIAAVALVVLGPERLPRVARTVGGLIGRSRRYMDELKSQVTSELELDELRRMKLQVENTLDTSSVLPAQNALSPVMLDSKRLADNPLAPLGVRTPRRGNLASSGASFGPQLRATGGSFAKVSSGSLRHASLRNRNRVSPSRYPTVKSR